MVVIVSFLPNGNLGVFLHAWTNVAVTFREADSASGVRERLRAILWNPLCSSPCSQKPATFQWTLSRMNTVHVLPSGFYNMPFNISVPSTPVSSKWPVSLRFLHQLSACLSIIRHTCYMTFPSRSGFDHGNNVCWGLQTMKFLTVDQYTKL